MKKVILLIAFGFFGVLAINKVLPAKANEVILRTPITPPATVTVPAPAPAPIPAQPAHVTPAPLPPSTLQLPSMPDVTPQPYVVPKYNTSPHGVCHTDMVQGDSGFQQKETCSDGYWRWL